MWAYEKNLMYPVRIANPDPAMAKLIITQLGGPDGELGAAMRYLTQRFAQPYAQGKAVLTDIGTEELAHCEMIGAIVYQLTRCLTPEQIKQSGFDAYFVDHTNGIYPQAASGTPFSAATLQSTGDAIADLFEDMAAKLCAMYRKTSMPKTIMHIILHLMQAASNGLKSAEHAKTSCPSMRQLVSVHLFSAITCD